MDVVTVAAYLFISVVVGYAGLWLIGALFTMYKIRKMYREINK